ncbi:MAG: DUF3017 domain-containing protein [Mycobacteriaceae bacterium]|nr:DUF3017 domain-containing protein [Mycobacteriaceae bacterium]
MTVPPPGHHPHHPHDELTRTARFVRSHLPMVAVALVIVAAVVLVGQDRWRRGASVFGVAVLLAAAFRLVLPEARVGLLAVRGRGFDVGSLTAVGTAIVVLATTIDPLGTG